MRRLLLLCAGVLFSLQALALDPPPTLQNLFEGTAKLQPIADAQTVELPSVMIDDNQRGLKLMPIVENSLYYTFVRDYKVENGVKRYVIQRLTTSATPNAADLGVKFLKNGNPLFPEMFPDWSLYDPHITYAGGKFWLTMECENTTAGGVSGICISSSMNPALDTGWGPVHQIITGTTRAAGPHQPNHTIPVGASTPIMVYNPTTQKKYLAYTHLDFGDYDWVDGLESTSTYAFEFTDDMYDNQWTVSINWIMANSHKIQNATGTPFCKNDWDCNNQNLLDWVLLPDNNYYSIYNGGNFYACDRFAVGGSNDWFIGVARSSNPIGAYSPMVKNGYKVPVLSGLRNDYCSLAYPKVNVIGNETYVYYDYLKTNGNAGGAADVETKRSKLVWNSVSTSEPRKLCAEFYEEWRNSPSLENKIRYGICLTTNRLPTEEQVIEWRNYTNAHYGTRMVDLIYGWVGWHFNAELQNGWGYWNSANAPGSQWVMMEQRDNHERIGLIYTQFLGRHATSSEENALLSNISVCPPASNCSYVAIIGAVLTQSGFLEAHPYLTLP